MDAEEQDLLALLPAAPQQHGGRNGPDMQEEEDDILALLPARRRFARRSELLCAHARHAEAKKAHARELDAERTRRRAAETTLQVAAQGSAQLQQLVPSSAKKQLPADVKAATLVHIACLPVIRSHRARNQRVHQDRAVAIVAQSLLSWAQ